MQYFYEHPHFTPIARVSDSLHFPTHLHQQPELYYLLNGTAEVTLELCTHRLNAGDLAVILPHRLHSYASIGKSQAYLCIAEVSLLGDYAPLLMRQACASPILRAETIHPDVLHGLTALAGELPEPLAKAYLGVVYGRILERLPLSAGDMPDDHELLPRVMRYVQENIRDALSLEQAAVALHVSKYRLSRLFSTQIGLNFRAYVNTLRVELAQNLLRENQMPITQVLYACGFESERTFYRAFQAHCGMTPKQYKQTARQAVHGHNFESGA